MIRLILAVIVAGSLYVGDAAQAGQTSQAGPLRPTLAPLGSTEPGDSRLWPADIAPELQRIQRELGGSAVERFPELQRDEPAADHWGPKSAPRPQPRHLDRVTRHSSDADRATHDAVVVLRDAAAQLDVAANKLERVELYDQADTLREQAQRLRSDARHMRRGVLPSPNDEPTPSQAPAIYAPPQLIPIPQPTTPTPRLTPTPAQPREDKDHDEELHPAPLSE